MLKIGQQLEAKVEWHLLSGHGVVIL